MINADTSPAELARPGDTSENPVDAVLYEKDHERQRLNVFKLTLGDLDELARRMTAESAAISAEAVTAVSVHAEDLLQKEDTDKRLEKLRNLVHLARLIGKKSADRTGAQPQKNFLLETAASYLKMIPYVGETLGGMIPSSFERMWLTFLATPAALGSFIPDGPIKSVLNYLGGDGQRSLAELDVRDALLGLTYEGESIVFRSITKDEWDAFQNRKDKRSIVTLAKAYIAKKREEHALNKAEAGKPYTLVFGAQELTNIDETKASVEQKRTTESEEQLKQNIEKKYGATLTFGDATILKDGALTLRKNEMGADGTPNKGSDAEALLLAKARLEGVNAIEITRGGTPSAGWLEGKRVVKIPSGSAVNQEMLRDVALAPKNKYVDEVRIVSRPKNPDGIAVTYEEGAGWVLSVPNNPTILAAIPAFLERDLESIPEKDRKWIYRSGNFTLTAESFPAAPEA